MSDDVVGAPMGPFEDMDLDMSIGTSTDGKVVILLSAGSERRAILPIDPEEAVWLANNLLGAVRLVQPSEPGGPDRDPRSRTHLWPEDIETLKRYVDQGVPTGSMFEAILSNDLADAMGRADPFSIHRVPAIVAYVHNELPPACWGSRRIVAAWVELHLARLRCERIEGKDAAHEEEARAAVLRAVANLAAAHETRG